MQEHSYSLLRGFENTLINVSRATNVQDTYGSETQSWTVVATDIPTRIDSKGGRYQREMQGAQGKDTYTLFIDSAIDIRIGDKIASIRDSYGAPVIAYRNGVAVSPEYLVRHVHNPSSEFSHLECDLTEIVGQIQN